MTTTTESRITVAGVSDSREVRADVSGMPPLRTAGGTRPLDPTWVKIRYHFGSDAVYVEIGGRKLFKEPGLRGTGYQCDYSVRRYGPGDTLPGWITELVEDYRPITTRDGWWR